MSKRRGVLLLLVSVVWSASSYLALPTTLTPNQGEPQIMTDERRNTVCPTRDEPDVEDRLVEDGLAYEDGTVGHWVDATAAMFAPRTGGQAESHES